MKFKPEVLFLQLIVLALFRPATPAEDNVGYSFESSNSLERSASGVFLLDDVTLPRAAVFRFSGYCVYVAPAWLQIWRPGGGDTKRYTLIGQARLVPRSVPATCEVTLYTRDEIIFTEEGDRLAIWNEEDGTPFAYQMVQNVHNPVYRSAVQNSADMVPGKIETFAAISYPYRFSVTVTFDTDVNKYLNGGTGTLIPQTPPPPSYPTAPPLPPDQGTITYTGNELSERSRTMEYPPSRYLLHHIKFRRGVVVTFYAYFVRKLPFVFQVWRHLVDNEYMLVGQHQVEPLVVPGAMVFGLKSGEFIFTQENDMLGFTVEGDVLPIGFRFIEDGSPMPFAASLDDTRAYPGYNVTFTPDNFFPYDFGIGAAYDTVVKGAYGTQPTIVITRPITTTPVVTTIPSIFPENMIGRDNIRYTASVLETSARRTWLVEDLTFPENCVVASFFMYTVRSGRIQLQVWRQIGVRGAIISMQLIGRKEYDVMSAGYIQIPLSVDERFEVRAGDILGFSNGEDFSIIGHHFQPTTLLNSAADFTIQTNAIVSFEQLTFPYLFAIAASYLPVEGSTTAPTTPIPTPSPTPSPSPTATPSPSPTATTTTQERTTTTTQKPSPTTTTTTTPTVTTTTPTVTTTTPTVTTTTPTVMTTTQTVTTTTPSVTTTTPRPQTPTPRGSGEQADPYSWLQDSQVLLGLFIWLIILTCLFFILCLVVVCRRKSKGADLATYRKKNKPYSFTNPVVGSRQESFNRWGEVKHQEGVKYYISTPGSSPTSDPGTGSDPFVAKANVTSGPPRSPAGFEEMRSEM